MRTLLRPLVASNVLLVLALAPASAQEPAARKTAAPAPHAAPQIRLVQLDSRLAPGGRQVVHYAVFQRVAPLLAVNESGVSAPDVVIRAADAVEVSYQMENDGWVQLGMLSTESRPGAASLAGAAPQDAAQAPAAGEPAAPKVLALAPVRPNPVSGRALVVDVALPSDRPARLELLDVMGRIVTSRDVGALGTGRHSVDLGAERRLSPGVYLLRLAQGGETRTTRVTVID